MKHHFNLHDRLIKFSSSTIVIAESLPKDRLIRNLAQTLVRSGTSVSLNYSEAISGESKRDYIQKMQHGLKELRETHACLRILNTVQYINKRKNIEQAIDECNQLIAIFVKSIITAKRGYLKSKDVSSKHK